MHLARQLQLVRTRRLFSLSVDRGVLLPFKQVVHVGRDVQSQQPVQLKDIISPVVEEMIILLRHQQTGSFLSLCTLFDKMKCKAHFQ